MELVKSKFKINFSYLKIGNHSVIKCDNSDYMAYDIANLALKELPYFNNEYILTIIFL